MKSNRGMICYKPYGMLLLLEKHFQIGKVDVKSVSEV